MEGSNEEHGKFLDQTAVPAGKEMGATGINPRSCMEEGFEYSRQHCNRYHFIIEGVFGDIPPEQLD